MTTACALKVLVLGGSSEASVLARALAGDGRFEAVLSLAGRTAAPAPSPLPRRIGGFGGVEGLVAWLEEQGTDALVVALHPFAARMRAHAAAAARRLALPLLLLDRPPWRAGPGDRWREVDDLSAARDALGETPRRVLLTVGGHDLLAFCEGAPHRYLVRAIDSPPRLPAGAELILARGPFDVEGEVALLRERDVEAIVSKNAGGTATAAKLTAARRLDIPVVLVRRPPLPDLAGLGAARVEGAAGALLWLGSRHDALSAATKRGV